MSSRNTPQDDWLTLVETEEPFLAEPVLRSRIGDHPVKTDTAKRNRVLEHCATLVDAHGRLQPDTDPVVVARWLLEDQLGHKTSGAKATLAVDPTQTVRFTTQGREVTQAPSLLLHDPGDPSAVRMVVCADRDGTLPAKLDRYQPDGRHKTGGWIASPVHRATSLARRLDCSLALIVTGRYLTLVSIQEHVVGHGTWDTTLFRPEPRHLDSLLTVLDPNRLFGPPAGRLEAMLTESLDKQQAVTKSLGQNVRRAAELLVAELSRADRRVDGRLLADIPDAKVYEAAVTVIMRTVFLLTAEENGLLPIDDELYREHYAASTLYRRLEAELRSGSATAQRRAYAWHRLVGLFRAVHGGASVTHDETRDQRLVVNAYGGSLFDPDRFPFLEGRTHDGDQLDTDLVSDLVMHDILGAITVVDGKTVSFRALDVEQIGHVYESLLDHSSERAAGPVLGVVGKEGLEPEIPLAELEAELAKGEAKFATYFEKATGGHKKAKWVKEQPQLDLKPEVARGLLPACGGDRELYDRVRPFANLLRTDLRGLPMVILAGDLYVTETTTKSDTGTAYTTKELADEIAEHALAPLVHAPGPQDTADSDAWVLKRSDEILALKVCDPAIGSAAIAVAAVRYLADQLVEARRREGLISDEQLTATEGDSTRLDVRVQARRDVVAHCIYGVDVDPMAVEMAKMSLWLVTMAKDRPFTFLDHAIKCGNSLLGISSTRQLKRLSLDASDAARQQQMLGEGWAGTDAASDFAARANALLAETSSLRRQLRGSDVTDIKDAAFKAQLHDRVEAETEELKRIGDALVEIYRTTATSTGHTELPNLLSGLQAAVVAGGSPPRSASAVVPLHWPLEFPEVFTEDRGGFDAFVANPPYIGNKYWKSRIGLWFQKYCEVIIGSKLGKPDLIVVFIWRLVQLLRPAGTIGTLATQSITEVASKALMEKAVLVEPVCLYRGLRERKWPGAAQVYVSQLWLRRGSWSGLLWLDGNVVHSIGADLRVGDELPKPRVLSTHAFQFQGVDNSRGLAFVVHSQHTLVVEGHDSYVKPYLSGKDLTESDPWKPDRYVVDLTGVREDRLQELPADVYDYLMSIVRPTRTPRQLESYQGLADRWWTFWNTREKLFRVTRQRDACLVGPGVSKYWIVLSLPSEWVYTNMVAVFDFSRPDLQTILQSGVFDAWLLLRGGTLGTGRRMKTKVVVNTFPLPNGFADEDLGLTWQRALRAAIREHGGATAALNHVHSDSCDSETAPLLRQLLEEVTASTLQAYGWHDLAPSHSLCQTPEGVRWSVAPLVREEVLRRVTMLNQTRVAR